jgi:hypothetical protein
MTRWSQLSDSGSIRRGWKALPSHFGSIWLLHTPMIATSGALMMGVKYRPPMPPSDEMVKQAPLMSAGPSLPSRAFLASSPISWLIWKMPFLSRP